jgi:hypothetical protein
MPAEEFALHPAQPVGSLRSVINCRMRRYGISYGTFNSSVMDAVVLVVAVSGT